MARKSIKKSKNGQRVIRVRIEEANIVNSVKTRLDEEEKTLTFYRDHECGVYESMEKGEFFDYWYDHINDEFKEELESVVNGKKWKRNKQWNGGYSILVSERPVHFIAPRAKVIRESNLQWTEWVIPLVLKGEENGSESEDSGDIAGSCETSDSEDCIKL